jgi:hypothetical protein
MTADQILEWLGGHLTALARELKVNQMLPFGNILQAGCHSLSEILARE